MATRRKTIKRDPFRLNEPAARIAGGDRRTSVAQRGEQLADIRARERLQRVLLQHDPDGVSPKLGARDMRLLRQIATEGALTNHAPMIRRSAIALLGTSPTVENLELLAELALAGEDFYVRSHALLALGATGLKVVAPLLRDALSAEDSTERQAAEAGLKLLERRAGVATLRVLRENESDLPVQNNLDRIRRSLSEKPTKKVAKSQTVRADRLRPVEKS